MRSLLTCLLALMLVATMTTARAEKPKVGQRGYSVHLLLRDGKQIECGIANGSLDMTVEGKTRRFRLRDILSVHLAEGASPSEQERITAGLAAITGSDRIAQERAAEDLTDLGLPTLSPLLASYKDTDLHEPNPLYRLFARIVPGYADALDRTLDLIRLANGETLRGKLLPTTLAVVATEGRSATPIPSSELRRLAVRRDKIERVFEVHALRHCTQIAFLDSGVVLSSASKLDATAQGYVRLDFNRDGWSSDPDGLQKPGPNYKTNLVDGFPFGALLGRIGATGPRWLAGRHAKKSDVGTGRLYFAINDNPHWQNNIGSYRVHLSVTEAYDLGEAQ